MMNSIDTSTTTQMPVGVIVLSCSFFDPVLLGVEQSLDPAFTLVNPMPHGVQFVLALLM